MYHILTKNNHLNDLLDIKRNIYNYKQKICIINGVMYFNFTDICLL